MSLNKITIKRINGEIKKFLKSDQNIKIYHNPDNILEIYFKIIGNEDSDYKNGEFIGVIKHHEEYPLYAPNLYMLTPNGRFIINKKICLTNTSYHQNTWAPAAWNLQNFLEAFESVWYSNTKEDRLGIGHIRKYMKENIINYSNESQNYNKKFNYIFI